MSTSWNELLRHWRSGCCFRFMMIHIALTHSYKLESFFFTFFCNNVMIKYPTTPQILRDTTLWNINVSFWIVVFHNVHWKFSADYDSEKKLWKSVDVWFSYEVMKFGRLIFWTTCISLYITFTISVSYRARNSKTKKRRKIKIDIHVPQGTNRWSVSCQLKRSKVKVTGRQKPQKNSLVFTYERQIKRRRLWRRLQTRPTPLLGLIYCRRLSMTRALILFIQTLALCKSFTYLLAWLLTYLLT